MLQICHSKASYKTIFYGLNTTLIGILLLHLPIFVRPTAYPDGAYLVKIIESLFLKVILLVFSYSNKCIGKILKMLELLEVSISMKNFTQRNFRIWYADTFVYMEDVSRLNNCLFY